MSFTHQNDREGKSQMGAAHTRQEETKGGITAKAPPLNLTAEPVELKSDEEREKAAQKKNFTPSFADDGTPDSPNGNSGNKSGTPNILVTLERQYQQQNPKEQKPAQKQENILLALEKRYKEQQKGQPQKKAVAPFDFQAYTKKQQAAAKENPTQEGTTTNENQVATQEKTAKTQGGGDGNGAPNANPNGAGNGAAPPSPNAAASGGGTANPSGGGGAAGGDNAQLTANVDTSNSQSYLSSLGQNPPSGFIKGMAESGTNVPSIQQKEKDELKENLPEIEQPTGLQTKEAEAKAEAEKMAAKEASEPVEAADVEQPKIAESHPVPNNKPATVPTPQPVGNSEEGNDPAFEQNIRNALQSLPTNDPNLNTSAGNPPKINLTGKANPQQNEQNQKQGTKDVDQNLGEANLKTKQDFGENDVFPEIETEMLKPETEMQAPPTPGGQGMGELPQVPTEVLSGFDTNAKAKLDEQVQVEMAKNEAEYTKMETDSDKEKETKMQELDDETKRVEGEQTTAQTEGKTEVAKQRAAWEAENEGLKQKYQAESGAERAKIDQKIDAKVKNTDSNVAKKLSDAENKAESERTKANRKAADEKRKANKKKGGGIFGFIGRALSAAFDALKSAVNAIFDGLRKLVKTIIEAAKKAVNALIELARKAVVGFIKAFGAFLKKLVSTILAAFPEIAKRINALIDAAVDKAVETVNKLAEALKEFANKLLDLLGKALDTILALYQKFYNLVLDALKFIAEGILKILEGLANLAKSAVQAPGNFMGQLSTELLGQDVTKPLPNERPLPATAATQATTAPAMDNVESPTTDASLLAKQSYTPEDFDVPVASDMQIGPELAEKLAMMGDGEFEFGVQNDAEHSMDAFKQEAAGYESPVADTEGLEQANIPQTAPTTTGGEGDGMVGPFHSSGERASHLVGQMTSAVSKWWGENQVKIIAIVVAGIAGLIAANIITGGAVMAALPLLMQIVGAYFAGEAVYNMAKHFGGYLTAAWPGNLAKGAQSLARGFAVGAIELAFALLFGGKAAVKGIRTVAKTARKSGIKGVAKLGKNAAKGAAKNGVQTAKNLGAVVKNGAKNTVKNGKFAMQGIKKGALKGAKSLGEMGQFLGKKFRFKKFRIRVKNRRFKVEGEINPWVLLADGTLKHVDASEISKTSRIGEEVTTSLGKGKLLALGDEMPDVLHKQIKNNAKDGSDGIFGLFGRKPGDKIDLSKPSALDGSSHVTYAFKNPEGHIVYVGRASIKNGTPSQALTRRIQKGHDHFHDGLTKEIIGTHPSRMASQGAEEYFMQGLKEQGARLTNVDNALDVKRAERRVKAINKMEAFNKQISEEL